MEQRVAGTPEQRKLLVEFTENCFEHSTYHTTHVCFREFLGKKIHHRELIGGINLHGFHVLRVPNSQPIQPGLRLPLRVERL